MLANQTNVTLPCSYPQPNSNGQVPCRNIFIKVIEFQEENIFQFIYTSANPTSRTIMKIPDFVKSNPFGNIRSIDSTNPYHGKCFQPCTNECEASYYKYAKEKTLMKRRH
jgi:hypothetical protein